MKRKREILLKLDIERFERDVQSRIKRKENRKKTHAKIEEIKSSSSNAPSYETLLEKYLPVNLSYILSEHKSDFHFDKLSKTTLNNGGVFKVPHVFSLSENAKGSFDFIKIILESLIHQKYNSFSLDYSLCIKVDLDAQVFLDIVLLDIIDFFKICNKLNPSVIRVKSIFGGNIRNENVKKLLYSVGSPAIHNQSISFPDIIPYKLCIHDRDVSGNPIRIREQKDLDTTRLVDYVLDCLKKLNRILNPDTIEDLSTVIGEILINAEEHSTTKYRFSIGYFHEQKVNSVHYGLFNLVILNFGKTIYEKFKDPECANREIVVKMEKLSEKYTKRNLFFSRKFEEETLWTLYALQEGVTSVDPQIYRKRGNGSIQFIESFFNIKGHKKDMDSTSKMTILSGNTSIVFDGSYNISSQTVDKEVYKSITFNNSGKIDDAPDKNFVKFTPSYFPGTIIGAKILFNEDDLA